MTGRDRMDARRTMGKEKNATAGPLLRELVQPGIYKRSQGRIARQATFYVLAIYFGSVAVKRTRYAVIAGLTADTVGIIISIIICRVVFGLS